MKENEKSVELQRCPHCDSDSIKLYKSQTGFWYQCSMCWAGGKKGTTKEEAAENWNAVKHLQNCPNCCCSATYHKSGSKVWYECNECWTHGDKCNSYEDAVKSWNALKPRPKKTRFEVLQEMGIANFAMFLQSWQEEHGMDWSEMTEDEIIIWLGEEVDADLDRLAHF